MYHFHGIPYGSHTGLKGTVRHTDTLLKMQTLLFMTLHGQSKNLHQLPYGCIRLTTRYDYNRSTILIFLFPT